jgi:hypothetical protein
MRQQYNAENCMFHLCQDHILTAVTHQAIICRYAGLQSENAGIVNIIYCTLVSTSLGLALIEGSSATTP